MDTKTIYLTLITFLATNFTQDEMQIPTNAGSECLYDVYENAIDFYREQCDLPPITDGDEFDTYAKSILPPNTKLYS